MTFEQLGVIPNIRKALDAKGYSNPTPIQAQSIPILLNGKDLLGCAQTGTGKTAAFTIPILQRLVKDPLRPGSARNIRALIVSPTRELAIQIAESIAAYGKHLPLRHTVIFGGVKQHEQVRTLKRGVDVLVATPGRLLDLINQGYIRLDEVEYFVLDEADQMLDMGFVHDIKKLIRLLPEHRQSLLFSATMPKSIMELARNILGRFEKVTVAPEQTTAERVEQAVFMVSKRNKRKLLVHLLQTEEIESLLVFSRTKYGADNIVRMLRRASIPAKAIHGNKSQQDRQKTLRSFKRGDTRVLVATDIAARGIDVSELSHVINYDLPNVPETYVHRIGRTGRASASGIAWSFCMGDERPYLADIQKLIRQEIPVITGHPFEGEDVPAEAVSLHPVRKKTPPKRQSSPKRNGNSPASKHRHRRRKRKKPSATNNP